MRKNQFPFLLFVFVFTTGIAQTNVQNLLVENRSNPIGLDITEPRFSWQSVSGQRNVYQTAYEIKVTAGKKAVWGTGKVNSDASMQVEYQGPALESGTKYSWQVRIWDNNGKASAWSAPAVFQMALLKPSDWKASWIQPAEDDSVLRPSPLLR